MGHPLRDLAVAGLRFGTSASGAAVHTATRERDAEDQNRDVLAEIVAAMRDMPPPPPAATEVTPAQMVALRRLPVARFPSAAGVRVVVKPE